MYYIPKQIATLVSGSDISELFPVFMGELKYVSSDTELEGPVDSYLQVEFKTVIRSLYTNKVVAVKKDITEFCFDNRDAYPQVPLPHKEMDLIMFLTSLNVYKVIAKDKGGNLDAPMMKSKFLFEGIHWNENTSCPVTVCTQILFEDEVFDLLFVPLLGNNYEALDISFEAISDREYFLKSFLKNIYKEVHYE